MEKDTAVIVQQKLVVEGCRVSSTSPKKMVINVCGGTVMADIFSRLERGGGWQECEAQGQGGSDGLVV